MKERDQLRIRHILDAITAIEAYIEGQQVEDLKHNPMLFDSLTKQLIIIGEAINHLSPEFQEQNPSVPFHLIIGMRNRLIHEYMLVNEETIWKTCKEDVPTLKKLFDEV